MGGLKDKEKIFQLLNERQEPFIDNNRITQIKVDGRLVRVEKVGDKLTLSGRDFISKDNFPEAVKALMNIPFSFKSDCEFACFEKDGIKSNFSKLQTRSKLKDKFKIKLLSKLTPVTPVFFDLLEFEGQQVTNEPYNKRKGILNEKFSGLQGIRVVKDWEDPLKCWKYVITNSLEGIVEKDKNSTYKTGRNEAGIKVKRKALTSMKFNGYETSNAGITLTNEQGFRVACNGQKHIEVKKRIDDNGFVNVLVRSMADKTDKGKLREIVFFSMED